uniref:Uncharacterized protein n=1 Tax=Lygus hesperus TaxID=30085 RepID=A0A146LSM2_LYGHE
MFMRYDKERGLLQKILVTTFLCMYGFAIVQQTVLFVKQLLQPLCYLLLLLLLLSLLFLRLTFFLLLPLFDNSGVAAAAATYALELFICVATIALVVFAPIVRLPANAERGT